MHIYVFLRSNKSNINQYICIYICIYIYISMYIKNGGKNGENVNPISEHRLVSSQLERAMNWVDRLRTSADERVLSGRHAVVIA